MLLRVEEVKIFSFSGILKMDRKNLSGYWSCTSFRVLELCVVHWSETENERLLGAECDGSFFTKKVPFNRCRARYFVSEVDMLKAVRSVPASFCFQFFIWYKWNRCDQLLIAVAEIDLKWDVLILHRCRSWHISIGIRDYRKHDWFYER